MDRYLGNFGWNELTRRARADQAHDVRSVQDPPGLADPRELDSIARFVRLTQQRKAALGSAEEEQTMAVNETDQTEVLSPEATREQSGCEHHGVLPVRTDQSAKACGGAAVKSAICRTTSTTAGPLGRAPTLRTDWLTKRSSTRYIP